MSQVLPPLPWHEARLEEIGTRFDAERLAHALVIAGRHLTGKATFADALAARALCRQPAVAACGTCSECRLIAAGTHPDLLGIEPVESKQIKVEQIRSLLGWMRGTPQRGGYRVVVLRPADAMNAISANALLKGLEEPGRDSLLLLVTDQPGRLLPTVRSRCQRINLPSPQVQEGLAWLRSMVTELPEGMDHTVLLQLADGSPVEAVVRSQDGFFERRAEVFSLLLKGLQGAPALGVAAQLSRMDGLEVVEIWSGLLLDVSRAAAGALAHCRNVDQRDLIRGIGARSDPIALGAFADELTAARLALLGPSNPNPQLLFEHLATAWADL